MRKLIVHKRRRQHAVSRAARHQKSETRRKRTPHLLVVSQCHRHRRTVRDIAEIASQTSIRRFQHRSRGVRRSRDNDGVKLITLISRRNRPAIILANYRPHWSRCLERRRIQSRPHRVDHRLHAIFERSKERPSRTFCRRPRLLSRRQHRATQASILRFHVRKSWQHRPHAQLRCLATIHAREQRIRQQVDHLGTVVASNHLGNGFVFLRLARRMKPLSRHPHLCANRKERRHHGGQDLGRNHEHQPIRHHHQLPFGDDISLAFGVVRPNELIAQSNLATKIGRPRLFRQKRVGPSLNQAPIDMIRDKHSAQPRAGFEQNVLNLGP